MRTVAPELGYEEALNLNRRRIGGQEQSNEYHEPVAIFAPEARPKRGARRCRYD